MRFGTYAAVIGAGAALSATAVRDARACGGCFHEPPAPQQTATVVTDHRMIFSVSPMQTTLYDQIEYSGSPSSFAWVLPTHGKVGVGLSSDLLFSTMDQATTTTITAPPLPPCPSCFCGGGAAFGASNSASGGSGSSSGSASAPPAVQVIQQQVVGPYATVQLHPTSTTDTAALSAWLTANGYSIPATVQPVIAAYVMEGFDFLALKLVPGQGVQAMRPISVTTMGAGLSLPLRMVSAGTGATVGITLWVVASGRYEPQNFQTFTISPTDLVWDWNQGMSNYTTLRQQKETALSNAGWQIESSINVSPYTIQNVVLNDPNAAAYAQSSSPDGGAPVSLDGGAPLTPIEARQADLSTLFPTGNGMVRITRMRADLSQAALGSDLVLQASMDQTTLSNNYQVTQSINAPVCPSCNCGGSGNTSGTGITFGSGSVSGSVGGSGVGGSGVGGSGNQGSTAGAGNNPNPQPATGDSFSCSTSHGAPGSGLLAGLGAIGALALFGARRRRSR